MDEKRYIISDAANLVKVEAHVLRYWEEELELVIPRNEMGHRYYTEKNIEEFQRIKDLKEQGYQLKAIKALIHSRRDDHHDEGEAMEKETALRPQREYTIDTTRHTPVVAAVQQSHDTASNMERFQALMNEIVKNAIAQNNADLGKEVTHQVAERILKEMNYLMRTQDEQEEERFRKLDEAIRSCQKGRRGREKRKSGNGRHMLSPKPNM